MDGPFVVLPVRRTRCPVLDGLDSGCLRIGTTSMEPGMQGFVFPYDLTLQIIAGESRKREAVPTRVRQDAA